MWVLSQLQLFAILIGAVSSTIIIYKFLIKRPELKVKIGTAKVDSKFGTDIDDKHEIIAISFHIHNTGRDFAEDCYIRVGFDGWTGGWEGDSKFDVSFLDSIRREKQLLGDSQLHHVFIDETIYPGAKFQTFAERTRVKKGETYRIEYYVACRTYTSTAGEIIIEVSETGKIHVNTVHPTFWSRIKDRFVKYKN